MAKQALEGTRLNAFGIHPDELTIVGLDTKDGPEHPLYDPRIKLKVDEGLVRNIMVYGVQETVLVRKNTETEAVEVVDGRQRVRCAREANRRLAKEGKEVLLVPCMVRKGEDHRLYGIATSCNEHRRDDGPLAKARKVARYLDMGRSEQEASITFNVTTTAIKQWLKLLELDPAIHACIDDELLAASKAMTLIGTSRERQQAYAKSLREGPKERKKRQNGAVSKVVLRKVVAAPEVEKVLHPEFVRGLRFALGEVKADDIEGLKDLVRG